MDLRVPGMSYRTNVNIVLIVVHFSQELQSETARARPGVSIIPHVVASLRRIRVEKV